MRKVRWGILGTARIALHALIPGIRKTENAEVTAIASRSADKARSIAAEYGIPLAFGSYEDLVRSPEVDVVYNPLPNHLHVPWSVAAMEAGKHVLCEKPAALSVAEAWRLIRAREKAGVQGGEAFMVRSHPQWLTAREMIRSGKIGRLICIQGHFSFFLDNPFDIRLKPEWGGGGLWDIGVYPVTTSRFIFGAEPTRAVCVLEDDPRTGVDRLASFILKFPSGQAVFTAGIGHTACQRMIFFGTEKRLEIEIPFNAPVDRPCRIFIDGPDLAGRDREVVEIPVSDQYALQAESFSAAVRGQGDVPVPFEETLKNTRVMEALFRSHRSRAWVDIREE